MKRVVTIGVYEWDRERFLAALRGAGVRVLLDVRQRRGVRGRQYAWAASLRLQDALAAAGIAYQHHLELAPTTALRQAQYAEDAREGVGKRNRAALAEVYREGYTREILDRADLADRRRVTGGRGGRVVLRRGRPGSVSPLADRRADGG